ncbi:MAG: hemolysin family protein [Candidatus Thiodiazotropha sp. (ex Lucinoma kastoroae)]|nr:hemolysin family protein [Candidatus Thiodiazotropha sp. (ex Rostrolucina anterorostrata)]MCU7846707.1 hemolysin family protein [Candidatus Thiodiazotropha sp. (ex Lucinoma kastoroae)]
MDWILISKLFLIILLIIGNAFFVGSEIALTSARRSRIKQLASTGNKSAKIVQVLHNEPERFYSVTQIGITLVSLALGAIGMVTLTQVMDPSIEAAFGWFGQGEEILSWAHTFSYIIAFVIISFLHVVAGELAPKVLAFHKAEAMSLSVAWIINGLHTIMRPLIWVMNHSSNGLLWLFGQHDLAAHGEGHFSMTGDEIRTILSASEQEGALDPQLTMMLRGVFDLDEHTARDAMIPRTEVEGVPNTATVADVLDLFKEELRERYPVYETSLDNIIGIVSMKELLNRLATAENPESSTSIIKLPVSEVMMPAYFVPDTMRLSLLLKDFTSNRRQIAIVLDEYGGTEGLITLEDILEEIVGDYEDEFTPRHRHIKMEDKQHFIINGGVRVTELEPKLNFPFPTGDYVTMGGLIHHGLGRIAEVGDLVQLEGAFLEVLEMDNHRITKVLFQHQMTEEPEGTEPQVEEKKANRSVLRRSSEKILKDKMDQPEVQEAEGATEKETDSNVANVPIQIEKKAGY